MRDFTKQSESLAKELEGFTIRVMLPIIKEALEAAYRAGVDDTSAGIANLQNWHGG